MSSSAAIKKLNVEGNLSPLRFEIRSVLDEREAVEGDCAVSKVFHLTERYQSPVAVPRRIGVIGNQGLPEHGSSQILLASGNDLVRFSFVLAQSGIFGVHDVLLDRRCTILLDVYLPRA